MVYDLALDLGRKSDCHLYVLGRSSVNELTENVSCRGAVVLQGRKIFNFVCSTKNWLHMLMGMTIFTVAFRVKCTALQHRTRAYRLRKHLYNNLLLKQRHLSRNQ